MEFRDAVRYLRGELGLTQTELAAAIQVNPVTVGRWENGHSVPSRSISAILMEFARRKSASPGCLETLREAIDGATREKLSSNGNKLYSAPHAALRELVDDAAFPLYICDDETDEILYLNREAEGLTGCNLNQVSGSKCYQAIFNSDNPCDFCHKGEHSENGCLTNDVQCRYNGQSYKVQSKRVKWNGRDAHARYLIHSDISDKLKSIIENINGGVSVGVYEDDGSTSLAYANRRYYELIGYTEEQLITEHVDPHKCIHPDDAENVSLTIETIKETRQPTTFRFRLIKRSGDIITVRCSSSIGAIEGLGNNVFISVLADISQFVHAEQQAHIFGQQLSAIISNINNGVAASVMKEDGTADYIFVADRYYEILGYTREQYHKEVSDPYDLIYKDDADKVRAIAASMQTPGERQTLRYRAIRKDGKLIWLEVQITIMTFAHTDRPVQLSVFTDITQLMEVNERLEAQRDEIKEMLNTTPVGIAVVEVDADNPAVMQTTFYNDRFFAFSGYTREEYDAKLRKNEFGFVFEEDLAGLLADTREICSGEPGKSKSTVIRCHTKDGGYRWLLMTGLLAEKRGNTCIVKVSMVDITARKEAEDGLRISEELLRLAAETDERIIVIYNIKNNSCITESRSVYSSHYGETIENVPGALLERKIVAPESAGDLIDLFNRIRDGKTNISTSLRLHTDAEVYQWFDCNAATVLDVDGQPDHAVLVFHNVTEQRIKEGVFKKWQNSIASRNPESYTLLRCNLSRDACLDKQDGELLTIHFPHDGYPFGEPTQVYIENYVYPEDRQTYASLVNAERLIAMFYRGERYHRLEYRELGTDDLPVWRLLTVETVEYLNSQDVQAFLMYEDIDAKKKEELAKKEREESDPLTGVLNRAAFTSKVETILSADSDSQHALLMIEMDDFGKLNEAFGREAGDKALVAISAIIRSVSREGDLICRPSGDEFLVWLRDIPYDAVIEKIARQMCEQLQKDFGQGVVISASIGIAVYPGDGISFDDLYQSADRALFGVKRRGKNSYAFFNMRENKPGLADRDMEDEQLLRRPVGYQQGDVKRKILIVDDDKISRTILSKVFENEYAVEIARNGADALMQLQHFGTAISVVLLDLMMPVLSGYEVLKRIQDNEDLRSIPVVVVSADNDRESLLKVVECGAADYITKPIDPKLIRLRVKSAISKADNERLRAQNSYLQLQRDEELKFHMVLESTETVVVEYDWHNHIFIYANDIGKYIAGSYNHRPLWKVFLSDMVASSTDVKAMQDEIMALANNRNEKSTSRLVMLKTPSGVKHWFKMNVYKKTDAFMLTEKFIITFNDVHEEVLSKEKLIFQATRDELTGLYNRAGFIEKATELIAAKKAGFYVLSCIDIEKFKVINDQYGAEKGDEILKKCAEVFQRLHHGDSGICCRVMADIFAVLYPASLLDSAELAVSHGNMSFLDSDLPSIKFCVGRCIVDDKSLPVSAIYDRAAMAKDTVKGRYDTYIATYDEAMRTKLLRQQEIISQMKSALESEQFEVWLQPQYNHATAMLTGAEALVRWRHPKDGLIAPYEFIPVFERNGFIYELDKFVWGKTCMLLRKWIDLGLDPVPVSVNVSRYDVFKSDVVDIVVGLTEKYNLPHRLLRLEITESAFSESSEQIIHIVEKFIELGFTVEIDDFGSGYSSLNTLKDVPAQVLKLDMRFLENDNNAQRGGSIIESVFRMANWLGMSVIAEGVETLEQADYLKSIGCENIQGYLYSRPIPAADYEALLTRGNKQAELIKNKALETWNNNSFWNPTSMETLIFNSYVGAACIFEYSNGKTELMRVNDGYAALFRQNYAYDHEETSRDILRVLDPESREKFSNAIQQAIGGAGESSCEFMLVGANNMCMHIRVTMRQIAKAGERCLIYAVINDVTSLREAEQHKREAAERTNTLLDGISAGVSACYIHDGQVRCLFANDRFYKMLCCDKDSCTEALKEKLAAIHKDDMEKLREAIEKGTNDLEPYTVEFRVNRPDGTIRWVMGWVNIVKLPDTEEPVHLATFADTTFMHKANGETEQAADSERKYKGDEQRALSDKLSCGMVILEYEEERLMLKHVNSACRRLFNCKSPCPPDVDVITFVHPDDRAILTRALEICKEQEHEFSCNLRISDGKDGYTVFQVVASADHNTEGKLYLFAWITPLTVQMESVQDSSSSAQSSLKALGVDSASGNSAVTEQTQNTVTEASKPQLELLDSLPIGAALYEYNGKTISVIHINKRYWELVGREKVDYKTASVMDVIYPDDRIGVMDEISSAIRQKRVAQADARILCGNSEYRPFRLRANITLEADGRYLLAVSYMPISDDEMSIQDMLPIMLSTVMSKSEDLSFIADKDCRYITYSKSAAQRLGLVNERDLIGKTSAEVFGKEMTEQFALEDKQVLETGKPILERLAKFPIYDGSMAFFRTSKYPLMNGRGKIVGIYSVWRDVTSEKSMEFEMDTLLRVIPSGVMKYSADDEAQFAYINRNFIESLGYTEEQFKEKFHNCFLEMVWKEDRAAAQEEITRQEVNGQIGRFDYRIEDANGELHWFHDEGVKVTDESGREWYYVTLIDITAQRKSESSLRLAEEEYRLATRHSGHTIGRYDIKAQTLTITDDVATRLALPVCIPDVPYGRVRLGKVSEDTAPAYIAFYESIMRGEKEGTVTFKKLLSIGWRWINEHATTIYDEQGKPVSAIISYKDVTEQQEKEMAYKKWQQSIAERDPKTYTLFRFNLNRNTSYDIWEGSLIAVVLDDSIISFNDKTKLFAEKCVFADDRERYSTFVNSDTLLAAYHRGHRMGSIEYRGKVNDGSIRWLKLTIDLVESPNSTDVEAYMLYESIDEQKRAELEVTHLAETDPLTGLLNRKAFATKVNQSISSSKEGTIHAFFMLDLDGFKLLNDSFGHAVGDEALTEIALRLQTLLRKDDLVGRIGGDEFVVFLSNLSNETNAGKKAEQICERLRRVYSPEITLTASIGVALYPRDGEDAHTLYEKADTALYSAKERGRDSYCVYAPSLPDKSIDADMHEMTGEEQSRPKPRMLIASGNPTELLQLKETFEDEYQIDTADCGMTALTRMRYHSSALTLVLMDMGLGGISSIEVIERARNNPETRSTCIIALCNEGDIASCLNATRAGADDYFPKPLQADRLRLRVNTALVRTQNQRSINPVHKT